MDTYQPGCEGEFTVFPAKGNCKAMSCSWGFQSSTRPVDAPSGLRCSLFFLDLQYIFCQQELP